MKGPIDIRSENRQLGAAASKALGIGVGLAVLGALGSAAAYATGGGGSRLLWSYLVNYVFVLSLALGALFFVLVNHLTHAGWSVVVRRFAEAIAANLPVLALFALPLVLGAGTLYHWTHPAPDDHVVINKAAYLNVTFFTIRLVVYFVIWGALSAWFFRRSVAQDASRDPGITLSMEKVAAPGMFLFALSITFAAFDILMSLDPHWFSTVFGVYFFSGAFAAFLALLAVVVFVVQRSGRLTHAITNEHYHDIGKFMFAFIVFWAYIAFSQYLLIWYANVPEETIWYARRQTGGWTAMSILLLVGHFVVPFFLLISRTPKRRPALLTLLALWVLFIHWIDIYWLVMPEMNHDAAGVVPFALGDVSMLLLLVGLFVALTARRLAGCSLVAEGDPRLVESLTFENV